MSNIIFTLQDFLHTPGLLTLVLKSGYSDCENWFRRTFPAGIAAISDITSALNIEAGCSLPYNLSYYYDETKNILAVFNRDGVADYCEENGIDIEDFNIKVIIVGNQINFSNLLKDCYKFNQAIDVPSTVKNARAMFSGCTSLNSPVTLHEGLENATAMFEDCSEFNQPLYRPSTLIKMDHMFEGADNFKQSF